MRAGLYRHAGGNSGHSRTVDGAAERYPASQHGTSLATLCAILGELALPAYPVAFEHRDLASLPLPAILHYGAGHYVLLAYRQGVRMRNESGIGAATVAVRCPESGNQRLCVGVGSR